MTRRKLMTAAAIAAFTIGFDGRQVNAQALQTPAFRGRRGMVPVAAVVRDRKGRFVQDVTVRDFEVLDSGKTKAIADFRTDVAGVSVAILFDVSGSMEGHLPNAREAARHVLSWLHATRDEAALLTLATPLDQSAPFTPGVPALPPPLETSI